MNVLALKNAREMAPPSACVTRTYMNTDEQQHVHMSARPVENDRDIRIQENSYDRHP
jgi:hypothetical protein